ncbi:hypothetical protein NPIL_178841 [Nephila pilipes]|uniref:Uncharacterized protein n=1 Tax=Nephila pilipes TaxID=299642 RepID=A0A8X6ND54_NEPPI|nr:hypothetical protein NPIL_178841 [Nephila pilipes]
MVCCFSGGSGVGTVFAHAQYATSLLRSLTQQRSSALNRKVFSLAVNHRAIYSPFAFKLEYWIDKMPFVETATLILGAKFVAGAVVGAVATMVAAPVVLLAVGFTPAGVAAGSIAAAVHNSIGVVSAGSVFAALQSAGAAGIGFLTNIGLVSAGSAVMAAITALF